MDIKVSKYAGFCFGVKRAVDMVNSLLDSSLGKRIFSLGDIIHNKHAMKSLTDKGLTVISRDDIERTALSATEDNPCTVVIRAHGIELSVEEELTRYAKANPYFTVCDLTCPFVKKIHNIVIENTDEDSLLIVYGDNDHPEVRGIVGRANGNICVISSADELSLCNFTNKTTIMVAQTTKKLYEWEKCKKKLKNTCTNALFFDTICGVTEKRQNDILCLAESSDLVLVIGDKNSSNSMSLLALAKTVCENSYLIESASDIGNISLLGINKVAITAGASTPGFIIEEVIKTMSEVFNTNEQANESFASMLEDSLKTLNTGDIVTGVITSISNTEIHVDLSCKGTGILSVDEIRTDPNTDVRSLYKVGDEIEAFVVRVSDVEGVVGLSRRRIDRIADWKKLKAASEEGAVVEGKITEVTRGGLIATVGAAKVFIPASQSGVPASGDLNTLVGTTQKFIIIEVNDQKNRAVGSIRAILRRERKALLEKFWAEMEVGKKFTGTVKSMTSYGVFVDLGGVDGLIHITDLSWGRINHPEEVVTLDQKINVVILDFDEAKKRIALGLKQLAVHPWDALDANLTVGDKVKGKVVLIADYGAFVEIEPGVEGLIHVSEMSWSPRLRIASDFLKVGDEIEAQILTLDREEKKMSLGLKQLVANPWENIREKYAVGTKHNATVRNITNFGVFAELEEGIEGLVHISDLSWNKIKHPSELVAAGDAIEVVILDFDEENHKLSLGHKQLLPNPWDEIEAKYAVGTVVEAKIASVNEKGAVVELEGDVDAFCFNRELAKEDGTMPVAGETLAFKVTELKRSAKKATLSHAKTYAAAVEARATQAAAEADNTKKAVKKINSNIEKTTLGDIDALAALKSQLESK